MSKKALILGLSMAILASTVGGAFAPNALAAGTLTCTPSAQTIVSGQTVTFSATYFGTGSFPNGGTLQWTVVDGGTVYTGTGPTFSRQLFAASNETRVVVAAVTDGYQGASCVVTVYGVNATPTPTPSLGTLAISQSVRNVTKNGAEGVSTTASNGDWLEFTTRVTTGSQTVLNVRVQDALPAQLNYLAGTTRVNNVYQGNEITTTGLLLGTVLGNQTMVVRFNAIVSNSGSTSPATWTSTATVTADNAGAQSSATAVSFNGGATPTPVPGAGVLTTSVRAQNVSRGQTGEYSSVGVRGGDTVNFIVRVTPQYSGATNVVVTDYLPAGFAYIAGSTTLNGTVIGDGITSTGVNIGTVNYNQTAIVRFSARMDTASVPTWGIVTVYDTVQIRADGSSLASAQVRLNLGNSLFATISGVQTGPADSLFLALAFAALVTAMYAGYARTSRFNRRMALAEITHLAKKQVNFIR